MHYFNSLSSRHLLSAQQRKQTSCLAIDGLMNERMSSIVVGNRQITTTKLKEKKYHKHHKRFVTSWSLKRCQHKHGINNADNPRQCKQKRSLRTGKHQYQRTEWREKSQTAF